MTDVLPASSLQASSGASVVQPKRLGVIISGAGSNLRALMLACQSGMIPQTQVAIVLSNRADAGGLLFAQEQNIPTAVITQKAYGSREAADLAMLDVLRAAQVDWVILAGLNRIVTPAFIRAFAGRILNIHPSLLPAYGGAGMVGLRVHAAVLAAGEAYSGCTVHVVTDVVDGGAILGQATVPVYPEDTPEGLAARVQAQEHRLFPAVLAFLVTHPSDDPSEALSALATTPLRLS
ncbi:MAG: phosphoribosylglycinamide formyltransferase [Candidatus Melainabacteria bacterium]|nr:phosphoribosylglycinamide formyltransferase [Candidatus Melainabacteria bacterium]